MFVTDPIADMLTRLRNAISAKHKTVEIPASKEKLEISKILLEEGYIEEYKLVDAGKFKNIEITIKYDEDGQSVIQGLKRISKPGLRIYSQKENLPKVISGLGIDDRCGGRRPEGERREFGKKLAPYIKLRLIRMEEHRHAVMLYAAYLGALGKRTDERYFQYCLCLPRRLSKSVYKFVEHVLHITRVANKRDFFIHFHSL